MKKLPLYVFLFFLIVYVLYSSGTTHSGDTLWQYFTGEALVTRLSFDIDPIVPGWNSNPGKPLYTYNTIGTSFLFMPFVILDKMFDLKTVQYTPNGIFMNKFYFGSFMTAFAGALMALVFFQFSMLLFGSRIVSLFNTILFALGSYTFYYSIIWRDIMPSMAGLFLSLYLIALYRQTRKEKLLLWSGLSLGFAGLCRTAAFFIGVIYFLYLAWLFYQEKRDARQALRSLAFFSAGILFFGLIQGYFNFIKFGNPFQLFLKVPGNPQLNLSLIDTVKHLWSYVASPGGSVFLYSPLLILAVPGFIFFFRKDRGLFWVMLSTVLATWIFYSVLAEPHWSGAIRGEYGNRYSNSILAFLAFPAGFFLQALFAGRFWKKKAVRIVLYALMLLTVLFQLLLLSTNSRLMIQIVLADHPDYTEESVTYDWAHSPLLRMYNRALHVLEKAHGITLLPKSSFVKDYSPYMPENFNFWHVNFRDMGGTGFLAFLLFAVCVFSGYKIKKLCKE